MPPLRLRIPPLANTGSTARDHLASERTFLAWLRTGLSVLALGIAVERFSQLELTSTLAPPPSASSPHTSAPDSQIARYPTAPPWQSPRDREHLLVGALLATGSGTIAYGIVRYFANLRLLQKGLFRPAYYGAGGLGAAVAGFAGVAYYATVRDEVAKRRVQAREVRSES
jgi:uncharacterized membrane protein YidH (DUF202 family)